MYTTEILDLFCAECRGQLTWREARPEASPDVEEGLLACACGQLYPVIAGLPRLQPASRRAGLRSAYPAFFARFPEAAPEQAAFASAVPAAEAQGTCALVDDASRPSPAQVVAALAGALKGARVLDAGCGDGRYARACAEAGAERVIAFAAHSIDAEAAQKNTRARTQADRTLVVEGHPSHPPFEEASFEVVLAVATFGFAARPERAVTPLLSLLRPGGLFASFWLADDEDASAARRLAERTAAAARMVSGRLPNFARRFVTAAVAPAFAALHGGPAALSASGVREARAALEGLSARGPERRVSGAEAQALAATFGLEDGRALPMGGGWLVLGRKPVPAPRVATDDAERVSLGGEPASSENAENKAKSASRRNLSVLS